MNNKIALEAGADELTPSIPQYFSWINNTNEGSTEEQTLTNLEFFAYLKKKYGMQIGIYAWDAGNFDGSAFGFGDLEGEKFRSQYPNEYVNIVKKAAENGIRMGLWGSPDGFGDDPETEKKRFDFFVHLCRDYHWGLFKFDGVCGWLREEKKDVFAAMMRECRKYSPDLICLNHRLNFYDAEKYLTTYLWNGDETYVDVLITNSITAMHNRAFAFRRGNTDDLERLAEDHGVCISASIDYFEDELIYQAFGRCLILAPEIYGNPWLMKDEELERLARIYNLHRTNSFILVHGMLLPESYGCNAVSRGNDSKRFICTGNDTWEKKTIKVKLDSEIGLKTDGKIIVNLHNPVITTVGEFDYGDEIEIELMPFRATLIEVSAKGSEEKIIVDRTSDRDMDFDGAGFKYYDRFAPEDREKSPVYLGSLSHTEVTDDEAEELYETAVFSANNDSLEYRSLLRAGDTSIPEVKASRDAFFNQKNYGLRGCENRNMFDGRDDTFFDALSKYYFGGQRRYGGCLRVDFGDIYEADEVIIECFAIDEPVNEVKKQEYTDTLSFSHLMKDWKYSGEGNVTVIDDHKSVEVIRDCVHTTRMLDGKMMRIAYPVSGSIRYLRLDCPPDRIYKVALRKNGEELKLEKPFGNNLQAPYKYVPTKFVECGEIKIPDFNPGSRLAVAVEGIYGEDEAVYVTVEYDGKKSGCPNRAPEYKANQWEHRVMGCDRNYTYFYPLTDDMAGKTLKIYAVFNHGEEKDIKCDVYLCDRHK